MKEEVTIDWVESIDSTNNELLRRSASLDNLSVLAAYSQTAGRGQRGNTWTAEPGENLTFSIFLRFDPSGLPPVKASGQFILSELITLTVSDWLLAKGARAQIKWPNDIYVGRRKIAGILIESSLAGEDLATSVIGCGLNLNQSDFPPQLVNPTSLSLVTGRRYDLEESLKEIMDIFLNYISLMQRLDGPSAIRESYLSRLYQKGIPCPYTDCLRGESFTGTILGLTPGGKLLVSTPTGPREFSFKEISYII